MTDSSNVIVYSVLSSVIAFIYVLTLLLVKAYRAKINHSNKKVSDKESS